MVTRTETAPRRAKKAAPPPPLRERDFQAWTVEQAALLRAGDFATADIARIAGEIESMGRAETRELATRLTVLLTHMLRWRFQRLRRVALRRIGILLARNAVADLVADNPSLTSTLDAAMPRAYRDARLHAALETMMLLEKFPVDCPWTFETAMNEPLDQVEEE